MPPGLKWGQEKGRAQLGKSHRKWLLQRKEVESHFPLVPKTSALHNFPPNNWSLRNTSENTPASVGVTDRRLQGGGP